MQTEKGYWLGLGVSRIVHFSGIDTIDAKCAEVCLCDSETSATGVIIFTFSVCLLPTLSV